jgi:ribonuclease R
MKKKLIAFFKKNPGREFKSKEIAKKIDLKTDFEYSSLKSVLYNLYEENFLSKSGKNYKLNQLPLTNKITGILQVVNGGYGFVVHKNPRMNDIFIAARNMGTAFNGDTVEAVLSGKQKGKNIEGQIIGVIKRKKEEIVGIVKKSKSFYFVDPDDSSIQRDIYIAKENLNGAKEGDKVIAGNIEWDNPVLNPEGKIIEVLGKKGSSKTEVESIVRELNIPYKFSENVLAEADKIEINVSPENLKGRKDFRKKSVITIDPEDAKDFDDALSIEELDNGNYSVGIHIADVAHYVKADSEIDKEASRRGNSIYLVGKVIPMLPEKLSNNICSLVPGEDRLTYSVIVELTVRCKLVSYEIKKTIINSKRRFNYDEVQQVIEGEDNEFKNEILSLNKLAVSLRKKRLKEGGIEFFTSEVKFELDENDRPIRAYKKEIKDSNMLVEEFMLLANKLTAKHIAAPESGPVKPFVYRVHDLPDAEKISEFAKFVKSLGYTIDPHSLAGGTSQKSKINQIQNIIQSAKGTDEESLINELAIRSMAKAVYSVKNIGHYGLGFKYYTHFTSPIRRYADLIVHRLLSNYLHYEKQRNYTVGELDSICEHISATERTATDAERLSVKQKQTEYLKNHLGEEFDAIISGLAHFGIFVKILDILAEGLIKLRDLEGDYYVYDEKKHAFIGKTTKKQFRLGDRLRVKLIRVDTEKTELDFIIPD